MDKEKKSVEISREAVASYHEYAKEPQQMDLMVQEIEAKYEAEAKA